MRPAWIVGSAAALVLFGGSAGAHAFLDEADPRVGIDLPLRMLLWQDRDATAVGYRDPRELAGAYRLDGLDQTLAQLAALLEALSEEACAPAGVGGRS